MTRSTFVALALLLAACDGGASDPDLTGPDGGARTDGGGSDAGPQAFTCAHTRSLAKYPWGVTAGTYLPDQQVTFGILADSTSSAWSRLTLEVWPGPGGAAPVLPATTQFSPVDRYKTCETCVLVGEGCDQNNNCRTYFFAQGGHVTVTEAGRAASGHLTATGADLTLVEWSLDADAPVPGGRCLELDSFAMKAEWGDGGACSGDACGSGCCADSPYCSLGDNSIGRYCSDFCGESGDGCTGPSDCCDGYSCFLGTCIVESCGNDSCGAGMDAGGGCCGQAPYCVDGGCAAACGQAGDGCGGDLDCCTGLACSGGTCQ